MSFHLIILDIGYDGWQSVSHCWTIISGNKRAAFQPSYNDKLCYSELIKSNIIHRQHVSLKNHCVMNANISFRTILPVKTFFVVFFVTRSMAVNYNAACKLSFSDFWLFFERTCSACSAAHTLTDGTLSSTHHRLCGGGKKNL